MEELERLFRKQWVWATENPDKFKSKWPKLKNYAKIYPQAINVSCFSCQKAYFRDGHYVWACSTYCPVKWPSRHKHNVHCEHSIYRIYANLHSPGHNLYAFPKAFKYNLISMYAEEISNLQWEE